MKKENNRTLLKKKVNAGYTLELALLMPIVLLTIFLPLHNAIELYGEVKTASEYQWDNTQDAVLELRKYKWANNMLGRD